MQVLVVDAAEQARVTLMAPGLVSALPCLVLFFVTQRCFIRGVVGGVNGYHTYP